MSDNDFSQDDINEMTEMFKRIMRDEDYGYELVFFINSNDAQELVMVYKEADQGNKESAERCNYEFGKIISKLEEAILRDEHDD